LFIVLSLNLIYSSTFFVEGFYFVGNSNLP
jgi:hypothetical protein